MGSVLRPRTMEPWERPGCGVTKNIRPGGAVTVFYGVIESPMFAYLRTFGPTKAHAQLRSAYLIDPIGVSRVR
jgi:hypothetical protein